MGNIMNLFDFSDYRDYLKHWLEEAKANKSFNLSRLAEVAQVHPTFLSHVFAGTKDLSLEQAAFISQKLQHTKLEQDYFFTLIHLDRAGTEILRDYWISRKKEIEAEKNKLSQRFEKHKQLTIEQRAIFYSSWIYAGVWSSTAINEGQTLMSVAERFSLSRDKAEEILSFLAQTGLCNEKGGVYSLGELHVHISNESPFVVKHHTNWRMKAIQKMDHRQPTELFFSAPMSISKKDFGVIREQLNLAVKKMVDIAKDSTAEEIVCLNIDFFEVIT